MHDKYLIASMKNGSVYVYFGDSGHLATVIEGHEGAVHSVTPSPLHEEILATAGVDGRFQIWHIERHRDYAARQEASINSGLASNTGANDTDDPKVSSSTSPLLFYYRYPPGRFHLAAGVVWLPAESTTADQPVWSGARRAVRETTAGTGPGHETSSDAYTHHGISSSSQLHQRITACRALPTSEGIGFVLVTKNGLMSVFRPGFRDVEQSSDSSLAAWGDHTISGHEGAVHSVTPSPLHEEILATAGVDGRFQIWHIERHRDYAARQEASINSGLASNTGANDTDDPKVSSSTSPLLFYYRYPPGRFHLAAGVVWLPAESTTADQPVWSGARRAVRETTAGTGPGHETSSDAYTHHGISSSSQLHQRITACRALPTSEGIGFVLVTKNGLMSVFRPGFRDVEQSSDSSLAAWGDHTISFLTTSLLTSSTTR
ncbi:PH-interacting protein [Fasciola hepatica]|uniref:PH-interacting protein n=1 Tax=Fasciola hepatica TaxID=6192 RepID=A0A4E0R671_FASHE|nr:PH-interacting protein [Fasciola hepatica]